MTRKISAVLAACLVLSLQASFGRAADLDPADLKERCRQQQLKIRALEDERAQMAREIYRLRDEVQQLEKTLSNIRSQIGHGEPRPTLR